MKSPKHLIFPSVARATAFSEMVTERIAQEKKPGVRRAKEIISHELEKQFELEGHGVSSYAQPWEHTQAEHVEAEQLVRVAFAHGLSAALASAEQSPSFPRNIDLFHDILTGKMYEALVSSRVRAVEHVPYWIIALLILFFALLLSAILFFVHTI
jgi:hypothetical protein